MAVYGSGSASGPRRRGPSRKQKQRIQRAVGQRSQRTAEPQRRQAPRTAAPDKPKRVVRAEGKVGRPGRRPARKPERYVPKKVPKGGFDKFAPRQESFASMRFPYARREHVGWANFKSDSDKVWLLVRRDFGGKKPKVIPSTRRDGVRGYAYRGRNAVYITPESYMNDKDGARKTLLHEIAHTRQRAKKLPKWVVEGGAEARAQYLARKRLGQRKPRSNNPDYRRYTARYAKRKVAR